METLIERIEKAKKDNDALDRLIADYMPFINKTIHEAGGMGIEYDDRLSLAMLAFMNCVRQFEDGKGSFITFAAVSIRNRLIDESRKYTRYAGRVIPLYLDENERAAETPEEKASIAAYSREREREGLSDEIEALSGQLGQFGVSFEDLHRICPRQERARKQCIEIGRYIAGSERMCEILYKHRRLAQSELAKEFGLSEKTVEKHRKYIVTIAVLLTGDYPLIRAFLPKYRG